MKLRDVFLGGSLFAGLWGVFGQGGNEGKVENNTNRYKSSVIRPENNTGSQNFQAEWKPLPPLEDQDEVFAKTKPGLFLTPEMQADWEEKQIARAKMDVERSLPENEKRKIRYDNFQEALYPLPEFWSLQEGESLWSHTLFIRRDKRSLYVNIECLDNKYNVQYYEYGFNSNSRLRVYLDTPEQVLEKIYQLEKELL